MPSTAHRQEFVVKASWDEEAGVYYVTESELPGLVAEGRTLDELREKILAIVPDLVELNHHLINWSPNGDFPIHLMAERLEKVRIPG